MAITKIRKSQLEPLNLVDADINASAAIASTKLADGLNFIQKNGSVAFTANQSFGGFKATNLSAPSADTDAATKAYVDSVAQGLNTKTAVRVATTANITLSGLQTIDGVALSAGNRVLVKNQTTTTQNGVYDVASGAWVRSADSDTGPELVNAFYFVQEGTTQQATGFVQSTPGPITIGTSAIVFNQFSGAADYTAGAGLTKTGLTFDVGTASSSRIVVNADNIDLATTGVVAGTFTKITVDAYGRATTGANATTTDISEGTNLYFTNLRAQSAITGAASTITTANLTASRALISGTGGKVEVSAVTSTELGHLSGVTSAIQTQFSGKQNVDPTLTTIAALSPGANTLIYFTGTDVAATTSLSTLGRTLIGSADAAAARTTLGLVIGTNVQAWDADLDAIALLSGTSGLLRKTAANTWSLDTATYLTANQSISLTGDVTGSGTTSISTTLASVGTAGTYTKVTTDAKGRVTAGSSLTTGDLPAGTIILAKIKTRETPAQTPDGTQTIFSVATGAEVGTEHVYFNGVLMEPGSGNDYLVTSQNPLTIQMLFIPIVGDKIRISYISI
jgi:hypothetical protein